MRADAGVARLLQFYILRQTFWPLVASVASLALLALLTQSIATLELIIDQRQTFFTYLQITFLALPQLVALIMPVALFIASVYAANRLQSESEVVVCQAAGMSNWQNALPILKLAVVAMMVNLAINLWAQPSAYRDMRQRLYEVQGDLAARMVRPGEFRSPADGVTIYARDIGRAGALRDILIEDARDDSDPPIVYMAQTGLFTEVQGEPALRMSNGSIQSIDENQSLNYLQFESYTFILSSFMEGQSDVFYKLSDRYLHELLFPDQNDLWDWRNRYRLLAEGHYRLSAPLYNPALALIALAAIYGGQFSRTGYGRRIAVASAAALGARLVGFAVQSAAADAPELNVAQYAVPIITGLIALRIVIGGPAKPPNRPSRERAPRAGGGAAGQAAQAAGA